MLRILHIGTTTYTSLQATARGNPVQIPELADFAASVFCIEGLGGGHANSHAVICALENPCLQVAERGSLQSS